LSPSESLPIKTDKGRRRLFVLLLLLYFLILPSIIYGVRELKFNEGYENYSGGNNEWNKQQKINENYKNKI
jgi:hypothetical protein